MKNQSLTDRAQYKRSLIMKVGATVLGLHIAAVLAFTLTQGCITTESEGSGRGAAARKSTPWRHVHKGNSQQQAAPANQYTALDEGSMMGGSIYDEPVIQGNTMPEPTPWIGPAPTANTETYIVQKGDILSQLAVDFDTTTRNLISLNNLSNPDVLYVGQELRVPAGRRSSNSGSASKSSSSVKKGGQYEIQKGDTLSEIAVASGVSIDDLRSLNNIENDQIFAGATIYIPSYGKVPSTTRKYTQKKTTPAPSVEPSPSALAPAPGPTAVMVPEGTEEAVESVETTSMQVDAVIDYIVYPGETLESIARDHAVSVSDIMRLNNISDSSVELKESQRLRIPISE
jgi:LysM repeat protein